MRRFGGAREYLYRWLPVQVNCQIYNPSALLQAVGWGVGPATGKVESCRRTPPDYLVLKYIARWRYRFNNHLSHHQLTQEFGGICSLLPYATAEHGVVYIFKGRALALRQRCRCFHPRFNHLGNTFKVKLPADALP